MNILNPLLLITDPKFANVNDRNVNVKITLRNIFEIPIFKGKITKQYKNQKLSQNCNN